jgi:osmotically inducible protein OsmC
MMATAIRRADAHWHSALTTGTGEVTLESGACEPLGISWPERVEDPNGQTSPEDLLTAAQTACFAMAFTAVLGREARHPERLDVHVAIPLDPAEPGGCKVSRSHITARAVAGEITIDATMTNS